MRTDPTTRTPGIVAAAGVLFVVSAGGAGAFTPASTEEKGAPGERAPDATAYASPCGIAAEPPEYYAFPLVPTRRVPGTGGVQGRANIHFGSTPFGVELAEDGSYVYELEVRIPGLPQPPGAAFVVWVTTPQVDRIERLGTLPADGTLGGTVRWNKFLVVVTLEPEPAGVAQDSWTGPIVLRGMSRSGAMHTMAGHGPFEQENCAAYGYY